MHDKSILDGRGSVPELRPVRDYQPSLFTRLSAVTGRLITGLPAPVLKNIKRPKNADGNVLDADVAVSLLLLSIMSGEDFVNLPEPEGRQLLDKEAYLAAGKPEKVGSRMEMTIGGVRVRHYRPPNAGSL